MRDTELREKYAKEPWGKLLLEMGMEPYDTESSARRVASYAAERIQKLEAALGLGLHILSANEPPDSPSISDEFAAMAFVLHGCANEKAMDIISKGMATPREPVSFEIVISYPNDDPRPH